MQHMLYDRHRQQSDVRCFSLCLTAREFRTTLKQKISSINKNRRLQREPVNLFRNDQKSFRKKILTQKKLSVLRP